MKLFEMNEISMVLEKLSESWFSHCYPTMITIDPSISVCDLQLRYKGCPDLFKNKKKPLSAAHPVASGRGRPLVMSHTRYSRNRS